MNNERKYRILEKLAKAGVLLRTERLMMKREGAGLASTEKGRAITQKYMTALGAQKKRVARYDASHGRGAYKKRVSGGKIPFLKYRLDPTLRTAAKARVAGPAV